MTININNEFDDTSILDDGSQLTNEASDDSFLAESIEDEKMRYEQVIRDLTQFEEDCEPAQD